MRELAGGVSAQVTELAVLAGGRERQMVVRRHGAADLERNPRVAADEYKLLRLLRGAGLPVPEPYFADESGEIFDSPYVAIAFVDGKADFAPVDLDGSIAQLAGVLADIHRVEGKRDELGYLPAQEAVCAGMIAARPARLDESLDEGRIRACLELGWPPERRNKRVLLHGDFWPGNVLWRDGRLAAVIDWEDAALGDPLADLANARLETLFAFGEEAMRALTRHYVARMPDLDDASLPYWELCAALRACRLSSWGLAPEVERRMRERHRRFVDQAFGKLSGPG
ncbi:phosphotransferase [Paenibacillus sp. IB182493]|uniref:Phosphotransferase n=2 Tax=Paenibacillus arenilitoris TaxID=2772299 RepID=A0A927CNG3_9BACL|nr:phosphotransferase [Paenibacillus arenilitoris]